MTAKEIIRDLFEEEALVIGGLLVVHEVDDDFVWRLIRSLDAIRLKSLSRLETAEPDLGVDPHPAIEEFLRRLRG